MFQGYILGALLVYFKACSAAVSILGGETQYFAADELLTVECVLNDSTTNVDFRYNSDVVVTCEPVFGCNRLDADFNVTKTELNSLTRYILHTVNNFNATFCGVYQCIDTEMSSNSDAITVLYKEFDIETYYVDEQSDSLMIATTCVFPAMSENIKVTWFSYEKSLQQLTSLNETVNVPTICSNITCSSNQAKSYSFGLSFGEPTGEYVLAAIEVHIVHSLFEDKPLVWRSSKTYPVKGIETATAESQFKVNILVKILTGALCFVVPILYIVGVIMYKVWLFKYKTDRTIAIECILSNFTLFAFKKDNPKIVANLTPAKEDKKTVLSLSVESHFYLLVKGKLDISLINTVKTINKGDGFGGFGLIYDITGETFGMNSEVSVKNDEVDTKAKIHALPRSYVLKVRGNVQLLKMERSMYSKILMEMKEWKFTLYRGILSECMLFSKLGQKEREMVASEFQPICFPDKEDVLQQNQTTKDLYIVVEGSAIQRTDCDNDIKSHKAVTFQRLDYFDLFAIRTRQHVTTPTTARGPLLCVKLDCTAILEGLKNVHPREITTTKEKALRNVILYGEIMSACSLLKGFGHEMCGRVADILKPVTFVDKQLILKTNEQSDDLFIIMEGSAETTDVVDKKETINKYEYFGKAVSEAIIDSAVALGPVLCAIVPVKHYRKNGNRIEIKVDEHQSV